MAGQPRSGTKRRRFLKTAGAGVTVGMLAGCMGGNDGGGGGGDGGGGGGGDDGGDGGGSDGGDGGGGGSDPIVIASLQPLSGVFSVYGPRHRDGAEFAAQQINANGGVNGREIQIQTVDTESNAQSAVTAFTRMIEQDGAVAGIGPGASEVAIRTGDVAEDREVPMYLHAAGAVEVVPKDARYTFRTALPATPTVGRAQAQIVEDRGYTEVGIIYEDGVWGDEFEAAVEAYFPDDINITSETAPIPQTDFVPQLRNFPNDVEVFLGTAHPAGVSSLYPQMYEVGLEPDLFLGAITPMEADLNAIGDGIERSFASFNSTDMYSDQYAETAATFNEEVGGLFDHAQVNGYVAVQVIAQSIENAGSTEGPDIAEATRTGSFDTLYGGQLEYSEWGEPKNSVQIYNGFDLSGSPDYWPDGSFTPTEEFRTDPLPAFDPDELEI